MTDTTTDDSTTVTPPTTGVGSASNEFRTLLAEMLNAEMAERRLVAA